MQASEDVFILRTRGPVQGIREWRSNISYGWSKLDKSSRVAEVISTTLLGFMTRCSRAYRRARARLRLLPVLLRRRQHAVGGRVQVRQAALRRRVAAGRHQRRSARHPVRQRICNSE